MVQLIRALSFFVIIYMMIVFLRVILTWFSWLRESAIQGFLARITDPYLNWFRQFTFLRIGHVDLSPMAGLGVLAFVNSFLSMLALHGKITIGITLALVLQALWGLVSVILGFLIIVLVLRLIAHLVKQSSYSRFFQIVDSRSQPVLYRITRFIFKDRIINFRTSLLVSIACLVAINLILRILVSIISGFLTRFPI
jgi:YggT family protein